MKKLIVLISGIVVLSATTFAQTQQGTAADEKAGTTPAKRSTAPKKSVGNTNQPASVQTPTREMEGAVKTEQPPAQMTYPAMEEKEAPGMIDKPITDLPEEMDKLNSETNDQPAQEKNKKEKGKAEEKKSQAPKKAIQGGNKESRNSGE